MMLSCGWFGITVKRVVAFGVKLVWSNEEVAKAQQLARAPVRCFAAHGEAIDLRVSGLKGLIDPSSPGAAIGIVAEEGRFRLAADPSRGGGAGAARLHLCLGRPAGRARPLDAGDGDLRGARRQDDDDAASERLRIEAGTRFASRRLDGLHRAPRALYDSDNLT